MPHPYARFEETPLWREIDAALGELERNRDLHVTTKREYVVGFLCQQLATAQVPTASALVSNRSPAV
jgi:hypothetical protein